MTRYIIEGIGYPQRLSATNTKAELIALGLQTSGADVMMLDKLYGTVGVRHMTCGVSETGVPFTLFPRTRGALSLLTNLPAYMRLLSDHRRDADQWVIISRFSTLPVNLLTIVMARLLGYRLFMLWDEWHQSLPNTTLTYKVSGWVADVVVPRWMDGLFPISHFIQQRCLYLRKPTLIVPVAARFGPMPDESATGSATIAHTSDPAQDSSQTADTGRQTAGDEASVTDYFVFCASAFYLMRNPLVLEAFSRVAASAPRCRLKLVLTASAQFLDIARQQTKQQGIAGRTDFMSDLPQADLHQLLSHAQALLVPLDPLSRQDEARFSQKIAEYVAAGRPIITSDVGEIAHYFRDGTDALIVPYTAEAYARAMLFTLSHRAEADAIGRQGFLTGKQAFDHVQLGRDMLSFMQRVTRDLP